MPTYDYKCKECGTTFEYFQKMTDEHLTNCIKCNGVVKRMIGSGMTPIFKGSGFYETDYKSKKSSSTKEAKVSAPSNENKESKKVEQKKSA